MTARAQSGSPDHCSHVQAAEADRAISTLVLAFAADPHLRWLNRLAAPGSDGIGSACRETTKVGESGRAGASAERVRRSRRGRRCGVTGMRPSNSDRGTQGRVTWRAPTLAKGGVRLPARAARPSHRDSWALRFRRVHRDDHPDMDCVADLETVCSVEPAGVDQRAGRLAQGATDRMR